MQHVEQGGRRHVRRQPLGRGRVNDLGVAAKRGTRDRCDAAARLDADQSIERGRRVIGPLARCIVPPRFDQRREGEPLTAADVDEACRPTAGCR